MEQAPEPSASAVLGLDNVRLDLPVASIGNRVLAAFLDHVILVSLMGVVTVTVLVTLGTAEVGGAVTIAVLMLALFLLNWGFFAVVEIALGGQTFGKRVLGLRVVSRDGGTPSVMALIVRNLLRAIDNLVGVFLIAIDGRARRLGDLLAGTLVIHELRDVQATVLSRIPSGWGAREVALVESFLQRCSTLEQERRSHLAQRILAWAERDDPRFLDGITRHADPAGTVRAAFRPEQL